MADKDRSSKAKERSLAAARKKPQGPTHETAPNLKPQILKPRPAPSSPVPEASNLVGNVAAGLSPAAHQPARKQTNRIDDEFNFPVALPMAFLGAGQGGGRLANAFWKIGYRRVAAFNTTDIDFGDLDDGIQKHSLDVGGAAKDTRLAKESLTGREEEIRDLLIKSWGSGVECAMICCCLGGGTGSGTCGMLVNIARQYMEEFCGRRRVGALISLPTIAEGYQICRNAVWGFQQLVAMGVSPLIIMDNAKIHQLYRPSMSRVHKTANSSVTQLLHLFNRLAAVRSEHMSFDESELLQLLDAGIVVMAATDMPRIDTPADVTTAIREELANNVLVDIDLRTSTKAACLFVGNQEALDTYDLSYFEAGFAQLDRLMGEPAMIHRGLYLGADPGLQCYTMVSDLDIPRERLTELARKGGLADPGGSSTIASFLGVG